MPTVISPLFPPIQCLPGNSTPVHMLLGYHDMYNHVTVLPLTRKWYTLPQPTTKIPISISSKKGIRLIRHPTFLSAISRAVVGVRRRLFDPSPPKLPRASNGYLRSALRSIRRSRTPSTWVDRPQTPPPPVFPHGILDPEPPARPEALNCLEEGGRSFSNG